MKESEKVRVYTHRVLDRESAVDLPLDTHLRVEFGRRDFIELSMDPEGGVRVALVEVVEVEVQPVLVPDRR